MQLLIAFRTVAFLEFGKRPRTETMFLLLPRSDFRKTKREVTVLSKPQSWHISGRSVLDGSWTSDKIMLRSSAPIYLICKCFLAQQFWKVAIIPFSTTEEKSVYDQAGICDSWVTALQLQV